MKHRVKFGSLFAHSLLSMAIAAGIATLEGCGGGGGPAASTDAAGTVNPNGAPTLAEGAQGTTGTDSGGSAPTGGITGGASGSTTETVASTPGWVAPSSVSLIDTSSISNFNFTSQNPAIASPGGIEKLTYTDQSTAIALNFDFGCGVSLITLKTQDCRNVVSVYSRLKQPIATTNDASIFLTLRNVDGYGEFALRVKDSTGQSIQYPIRLRTLERYQYSDWTTVRVFLKNPALYWGGAANGVITGSLVEVSVVAAPRNSDSATTGLNYPKGQLEIKDIRLSSPVTTTYTLQTNAPLAAGAFYPNTSGRMAVAHGSFDLNLMQKAKRAGFSVIRRDLLWENVETNGQYSFVPFDTGTSNLTSLGMKVLWILDYGHPDHGGDVPVSLSDKAAYVKFVQEAAKFGKTRPVMGYEIWNEPDTPGAWPSQNPLEYADLLSRAVTGLRQVEASLPIFSAGVGISDPAYLFKLSQTGALSGVTYIGTHPYRKDTITVASPYRRNESTPESYAADHLVARQYLAQNGVSQPLANTEWGYSSYEYLDRAVYGNGTSAAAWQRQGILTLRMVLAQLAVNEPLITVYRLIDKGINATDKEMNFGLLDANQVEKPAYKALVQLNTLTGSKTFKGYLTDVPNGLHVLRWDGSGAARVFCAWSENDADAVDVVIPAGYKAVTAFDGTALTPHAGAGGALVVTVRESSGPIFISL
ncbi:hypothetical protein JY96_15545 [Aquabacterium sp. NJ1]|uniref:GH39 family glycosyl hydrolase n=1 Tax=Aquabacterium sp. NJ1 TaxID=1538295 RepID=UPI00052E439E|nr:cellulase family glycosylhydrolase [Aquabacterium sp. NJ1]KGM40985.1 hypothetical protein JY96_15545 [Aquabacterium sp. NJ1]